MAEQRLSKLQKWILMALFILGPEYRVKVTDLKRASVWGLKIWGRTETLESPWKRKGEGFFLPSMDVSFSRTLRRLEEREFIFTYAHTPFTSAESIYDLQGITREKKQEIKKKMGVGKSGKVLFPRLDSVTNIIEVAITAEGCAKAKELLNVKNAEVNNKEGGDPGCENV